MPRPAIDRRRAGARPGASRPAAAPAAASPTPAASGSASAGARAERARRDRRRRRLGSPATTPTVTPVLVTQRGHLRQARILLLVPRQPEQRVVSAPDRTARSPSTTSAATGEVGRDRRRHVRLGDRGRARHLRRRRRPSRGRARGAPSSRPRRPAQPAETIAHDVRRPGHARPRSSGRPEGAGRRRRRPLADVGGDVAKISTDAKPVRASTRPRWPTRSRRRSRSS